MTSYLCQMSVVMVKLEEHARLLCSERPALDRLPQITDLALFN